MEFCHDWVLNVLLVRTSEFWADWGQAMGIYITISSTGWRRMDDDFSVLCTVSVLLMVTLIFQTLHWHDVRYYQTLRFWRGVTQQQTYGACRTLIEPVIIIVKLKEDGPI